MMKYPLNYVFSFGKYKHLPIYSVLKFNPQYIQWLCQNKSDFVLEEQAQTLLKEQLAKHQRLMYARQQGWAYGFGKDVAREKSNTLSYLITLEHDEREKHMPREEYKNWLKQRVNRYLGENKS